MSDRYWYWKLERSTWVECFEDDLPRLAREGLPTVKGDAQPDWNPQRLPQLSSYEEARDIVSEAERAEHLGDPEAPATYEVAALRAVLVAVLRVLTPEQREAVRREVSLHG